GLTADSPGTDFAEAATIGMVHQIVDAVEAVQAGLAGPFEVLRIDGGVGRNDSVLQAIADLTGLRLERSAKAEVTALGAGALAGLGTGLFGLSELAAQEGAAGSIVGPHLPAHDRAAAR